MYFVPVAVTTLLFEPLLNVPVDKSLLNSPRFTSPLEICNAVGIDVELNAFEPNSLIQHDHQIESLMKLLQLQKINY